METRQTTSNLTTVPLEFQQVTIFFDVIPDILGNSYLALPLPLQLGEERAPDFDPLILSSGPKYMGTSIRDKNASSNVPMRLVVSKRIP